MLKLFVIKCLFQSGKFFVVVIFMYWRYDVIHHLIIFGRQLVIQTVIDHK